jgi:hypothetical protein
MSVAFDNDSGDATLLRVLTDLSSEVNDEAEGRNHSDRPFQAEVFLELMLERYLPSRGLPDAQLGSHSGMKGNARSSIGGAVVSDDGKQLVLFNMDYRSATEMWTIQRPTLVSLAGQTLRFFRDAVGNTNSGPLSQNARALAEMLRSSMDDVETITVVLFTDGLFAGKEIPLEDISGRKVACEVFDIRSLSRLTDRSVRDVSVPFLDRDGNPIRFISRKLPDPSYDCSLVIVSGAFLAELYQEYDVALLEYNVRAFLGSNNKVNAGIRRTLKTNQERFLAYNNGISATARDVELTEDGSAVKFVHGLQIVNGGQTLAALHHVMYAEKTDISRAEVAMKLTVVREADEPSFVGEISSYANTQSIVQIADFSANRPFHIEIERLSRSVWIPGERGLWFYERTRGQYNVARSREGSSLAAKRRFKTRCPPARKFSKTDLAKYINAWAGLPHLVSNGAQYNYKAWLDEVEEGEWSPTEDWYKDTIAKAIIFKAAQKAVREGNFPGYRAQIVAYLVGLVSERIGSEINLRMIWQRQAVSAELSNLLSLWAHVIEKEIKASAGRNNVTQHCKRLECWEAVANTSDAKNELSIPERRRLELA